MLEQSRVYFKEGGQQGFMAPYRIELVGETKLEDDAGGVTSKPQFKPIFCPISPPHCNPISTPLIVAVLTLF